MWVRIKRRNTKTIIEVPEEHWRNVLAAQGDYVLVPDAGEFTTVRPRASDHARPAKKPEWRDMTVTKID